MSYQIERYRTALPMTCHACGHDWVEQGTFECGTVFLDEDDPSCPTCSAVHDPEAPTHCTYCGEVNADCTCDPDED